MNRLQRGRRGRRHSRVIFQKNTLILFCLILLFSPFGSAFDGLIGKVSAEGGEETTEITDVEESTSTGLMQPLGDGDTFSGGDGTANDPYIIETAEQLDEVRNHLTKHFKLNADINLGVAPYNQGDGWNPIGIAGNNFLGSFDGNGHTISNIMIDRNEDNIGLFGVVNGSITRVTLVGVNIKGKDNVGGLVGRTYSTITDSKSSGNIEATGDNTGGLVGYLHGGTIEGSSSAGEVNGTSFVGGLVGRSTSGSNITASNSSGNVEGTGNNIGGTVGYHAGTISRSSSAGNVTGAGNTGGLAGSSLGEIMESFATSNVKASAGEAVGGLVGRQFSSGEIKDTYATGTVTGHHYVGGLIGWDQGGKIKSSYAIGFVTATSGPGGLVARIDDTNTTIADSFYDSETTGQTDNDGRGVPKSTTELQTQTTFTNWDFANVWDMPTGDYPRLQWEGIGGQPPVDDGDIIYVKENGAGNQDGTSWDHAFATLQEGLDVATEGKEIWMGKGTYYPTKAVNAGNDRTKTFRMESGVAIYGGFKGDDANEAIGDRDITANETVLSGDIGTPNDNSDNAYHVVINENINGEATINGVTIENGNANGQGHNFEGGGIRNIGETSILNLNNVVIQNNYSRSIGAGVYNDKATINASNITIQNNTSMNSGGGINNYLGSITIHGGLITKNTAAHYGGGISNWQITSMELIGVEISYNKAVFGAGGIQNNSQSSPIIHNSIISFNETEGSGGGISNDTRSNPELANVLIMNNKADNSGGGFYNTGGSSPNLTNITIIGNSARFGGAMFNNSHSDSPDIVEVTLNNSIVWGNMSEIAFRGDIDNSNSTTLISYSLLENSGGSTNWNGRNGTDNGNNIDAEPRFVDPTNNNYHLQASSPAINAGNNDYVPISITTDLAGDTRIFGASVDMGAYEFQGEPIVVGGDVTAFYVDEDDNEIAGAEIHSGNVGEAYTTVEKVIAGYTLTVTPANATGTFTADPQEVKYVYEKDEVTIPDRKIDRSYYSSVPLKTGWYDITDLPLPKKMEVLLDDGNKVELEVRWNMVSDPVYDKDAVGNYLFSGEFVLIDGIINPDKHQVRRMFVLTDSVVNVTYEDEDGNKLADDVTLKGKLNTNYETEEKKFAGYTLTEMPDNATGTFLPYDQTVEYIYSKSQEESPFKVIVEHVDEDGNKLADDEILTGKLFEDYTTSPTDINGYTLTEIPYNATGTFQDVDQTVTYVYKQDEEPKEPIEPEVPEEPEEPKTPDEDPIDSTGSEENSGDGTKGEQKDNTNKLPKTATPYYTILLAGLLLLLIGGVAYLVVRRKQVS